jgi:hypothetical protein
MPVGGARVQRDACEVLGPGPRSFGNEQVGHVGALGVLSMDLVDAENPQMR